MGWLSSIEHNRWLSHQMQALVYAERRAMVETGFGYVLPDGSVDTSRSVDLATTGRITHAFCLATLMGIPGSRKYADHGLKCLRTYFMDPEYGGWYQAIEHHPDEDGHGIPAGESGAEKWQYATAFVVLAAASGTAANRAGAHELLQEVIHDQERHWWDEKVDRVRDRYSRDYSECQPYRGMNSNMHTTEAYLAVAEVMNDPIWIDRATSILRFVYEEASQRNWRLGEHYDDQWRPMPEHYQHSRDDHHYPFGVVIGHQMEWARLTLHARAANRTLGRPSPDWMLEMAREMFERARVDGWRRGGNPGFVYTVDFDGQPVATNHMAWVAAEAVAAAVALRRAGLDDGASEGEVEHYDHCYRSWIDFIEEYIIAEPGAWNRSLSENNDLIESSLPGLQDYYHALQALLMPRLPLWPPFASALSRGLLDKPEEPPADRKGFRLFRGHKHE